MSYGRQPYYIYSDGDNFHFNGPDIKEEQVIPHSAMAQLLWHLVLREESGGNQLAYLINKGGRQRPDNPKWGPTYQIKFVENNIVILINTHNGETE